MSEGTPAARQHTAIARQKNDEGVNHKVGRMKCYKHIGQIAIATRHGAGKVTQYMTGVHEHPGRAQEIKHKC